jgi:hypothetical protein
VLLHFLCGGIVNVPQVGVYFNFHPEYHEVISHFVGSSAEANGEKHARILSKGWVVWN